MVWPEPAIVPPFQVRAPVTVSVPAPSRVPPVRFNVPSIVDADSIGEAAAGEGERVDAGQRERTHRVGIILGVGDGDPGREVDGDLIRRARHAAGAPVRACVPVAAGRVDPAHAGQQRPVFQGDQFPSRLELEDGLAALAGGRCGRVCRGASVDVSKSQ